MDLNVATLHICINTQYSFCVECGAQWDTTVGVSDISVDDPWSPETLEMFQPTFSEVEGSFIHVVDAYDHADLGHYIRFSFNWEGQILYYEMTDVSPASPLYVLEAGDFVFAETTRVAVIEDGFATVCDECDAKLHADDEDDDWDDGDDWDDAELDAEEEQRRFYLDIEEVKPEDNLFDIRIWAHGVSAYNPCDLQEQIERMEHIRAGNIQICAADKSQPIGPVGLYLQGQVLCVSTVDLWSYIDEDGRRYTEDGYDHVVKRLEEYRLDQHDHVEIILNPRRIVGVWVKDWYIDSNPSYLPALQEYADTLGVKLYVVKPRHVE